MFRGTVYSDLQGAHVVGPRLESCSPSVVSFMVFQPGLVRVDGMGTTIVVYSPARVVPNNLCTDMAYAT